MKRILIAEDKPSMLRMLSQVFSENHYQVIECHNGAEAVDSIRKGNIDLIITDLKMPGADGLTVLQESKKHLPETPVIIITAFGTVENAVEAMREGAFDYILKPFSVAEIEVKVAKALEQKRILNENEYLKTTLSTQLGTLIGRSQIMQDIYKFIMKVALGNAPVMILGESGTGKELVAREIHNHSSRANHPFIPINSAALAEGVLESEMFGHEKGAFTGAIASKKGLVEQADGGTLFLDEIGDLGLNLQAKLLRFLQEKEFKRVGGLQTLKVDVRVLAATHQDLQRKIAANQFRQDLYYRLNVITISLPALREHLEDLPDLIDHFCRKYCEALHKTVRFPKEVLDILAAYHWPGNIRELKNVIERAVVLAEGPLVRREELPREIWQRPPQKDETSLVELPLHPDASWPLDKRLERLEQEIIKRTLEECRGNQTQAAKKLGLKRSSLQYKIQKYGLLFNHGKNLDDQG
jgi:DNA-binding NtrC family response regulator